MASQIAALQGTVSVASEKGKGCCFTLTVPLTLTKIRVLLVKAAGQTFAFPSAVVQRLLRINPRDIRFVEGKQVLQFDGQLISVTGLAAVLKLANDSAASDENRMPAVVLVQGGTKRAFLVDELLAEQEVVVTNLGARLQRLPNVSGATLLGTGEIALILNASELMRRHHGVNAIGKDVQADDVAMRKSKRLIVADDSPTTRILESSILEAAGYDVISVPDGQDAWNILQAQGADLIVSDVEMPIMNGFDLTRTVRASEKWRTLPVILVTGLAKESDREQGLKAGASAYVVKSEFDQLELLDTIEQLI